MSNLFSPSKAKMEIKPGQALLKRKATRTCVRTPRSPKVPSFEKYVVYVYYFHDVYTYMFILSSFIAKISLLIVGYRRSQEYKPRRNADPRNLTFHESFKDIVHANEAYGDGSIVILTTPRLLKLLLYSTGVHIDGTFKITPEIFYSQQLKGQVLGMHVIYGGKLITCALTLLPGKTEALYFRALQLLDAAGRGLNFEGVRWLEVMLDFEVALGNALRRFKPDLRLKGCYFHYCQAVVRYCFVHCRLKSRYLIDLNGGVRLFVRSLLALAYVEGGDEMIDAREELFFKYETQRADVWSLDGARFTIIIYKTYLYTYIYERQNYHFVRLPYIRLRKGIQKLVRYHRRNWTKNKFDMWSVDLNGLVAHTNGKVLYDAYIYSSVALSRNRT